MFWKTYLPLDVGSAIRPGFTLQSVKRHLKGIGWLNFLRKKLQIRVWYVSGTLKTGNERLNIIFRGRNGSKKYLSNLAFGNQYTDIKFGIRFLYTLVINYLNRANSNTLLIYETRKISADISKPGRCFAIPEWLGGYIDLSIDLELHAKANHTAKSNIKKIINNNFTYEVTRDPLLFGRFYHDMYREYALKRYGDTAIVMPYEKVEREYQNGELLLVKDNGRFIAGTLIGYNQETGQPYLSKLGVLNADMDHVSRGAISAIYYFSILHLKNEGYNNVALGGTRPFLNDGVLKYKTRNWNMNIEVHPDSFYMLKPMGFGSGVKTFLLNNPFVCFLNEEPCGIIFTEKNETGKKVNIEKLKKKYEHNGLSRLIIKDVSQVARKYCS